MLLRKTLSLSDCDVKFASAEGRFTGYGSVFNNLDSNGSIIRPGAYADVLAAGAPVDVYVNHGWMRDELPVGRWSGLAEDQRGLFGTADLVMQMRGASDAYWAMKSGLVSGLSVAIIPDPKGVERRADGVRIVHRIKALKEISIVTDPANAEAQITDLKFVNDQQAAEMAEIETIRDFERYLRDAGGLSKGTVVALMARARVLFGQGDPAAEQDAHMQALADRIARLAA
jgi:HK97 family phage prohead protease